MKPLTRGEVARRAGVGLETVRFYEKKGLIPEPARSESGYRHYTTDDIARIRFIARSKDLGFSLREIGELLSLRVDPAATCADVKQRTESRLADARKRIRDLRRIERALVRLRDSCSGEGPTSECPILENLQASGGEVPF